MTSCLGTPGSKQRRQRASYIPAAPTTQRPVYARPAAALAALIYVLLLAWNVSALRADFAALFAPDNRQGEYNPIEPVRLR